MVEPTPQKTRFYHNLQQHTQAIYAEIRQAGIDLGITPEYANQIGLTGAISGCHGFLAREVAAAMDQAARKVIPSAALDEQLRQVVKDFYGDGYDAALVSTCEAGISTCLETLFAPPLTGRGEPYRGRYIALYERFLEHQASYGRPFPPRYKEIIAERGETAGETGVQGKRLAGLDVILARMEGADYPNHGIKYNPIPNLIHTDAARTIEHVAQISRRHERDLVGYISLGYDTPGYGYGQKGPDGVPLLQSGLAALAQEYDVPYIVDNAWGVPFLGADIRKLGCDAILYSMDKVTGSPTCGLIIGKEEPMVAIRRALGIHGARYGTLSSHGKAALVGYDPGKEALVGALAALRLLQERPEAPLRALADLQTIVLEEFDRLPDPLKTGWSFYPSTNSLAVELNYADTWTEDRFGIPIFSMEDMYSGSHLIQFGLAQMGILPTVTFDANILISNGLGNLDEDGSLIEQPTRLAVRGLFKTIEIVSRYAGLISSSDTVGKLS